MPTSLRYTSLFVVTAITAALLVASGCASEPEAPSADLGAATTPAEPADVTPTEPTDVTLAVGLAQLDYLTEEWAPFNYEADGEAAGVSVDILEAVFRRIGVDRSRADVRIVPLADGFRAAQEDTGTV